MDAVKAIKILRSMDSSGRIVDEDTGEVGTLNLAEDSLARSIINKIINCSLEDLQMLMNQAIGSPKRRGFPWTSKEEHEVANLFSNGVEIKDIANRHERSITAIKARMDLKKQTESLQDWLKKQPNAIKQKIRKRAAENAHKEILSLKKTLNDYSPDEWEHLVAYHEEKLIEKIKSNSLSAIALFFGISFF